MEISTMGMYLIVKLDDIRFLFGFWGTLSFCVFGLITIMLLANGESENEKQFRIFSTIITGLAVLSFIFATFLPSTKQIAAIYVIPKIINDERVKQIPDKFLDLGLEWLEDLKPKEKK